MFYGLIEHIKETNANTLKDLLINFVSEFSDIENKISYFEKEIEKKLNSAENDIATGILTQILHDEITKIDGKIELFEELEEKLTEIPHIKDLPDARVVINEMLSDYKTKLFESTFAPLSVIYGVKVDVLIELKNRLI